MSWDGATVWSYLETRSTYHPHHDFTRIYNPKLGAYTTLYIANKDVSAAEWPGGSAGSDGDCNAGPPEPQGSPKE